MSDTAGKPTRIHLLGEGRFEEADAGGAITPGHLIKLNSAGKVVVHDDVQGWAEKAFAIEDALQGRTIATAYAANEKVFYVIAKPGDVVYGWLAGGELAVIGSFLCSNGDGTMQVADDSDISQQRLAVALEALDQSESDEVDDRIRMRIL